MLQEREMVHSGKTWDGSSHGGESAKGQEERGQELKTSRYGYNQEKNQGSNLKSQVALLKAWKSQCKDY